MKKNVLVFAIASLFAISCNDAKKSASSEGLTDAEIIQTAKDAYLFGYPAVVMDVSKDAMTNLEVPSGLGAPINQLASVQYFPDDKSKDVVRPNDDTYYSWAWLDVGADPIVIEIPNTNDRYFLFPLLDAWTNVFFSPGKRTTGTQAQKYLITSPKWTGTVPEGVEQVKSPTDVVWLIGRTQVNSPEDGATVVKKIQEGYKLIPLSSYGKPYTAPKGKINPNVPKQPANDVSTGLSIDDYFNRLNKIMVNNPPAAADADMMAKLAKIAVAPGEKFDLSKFSAAVQDSLKAIPVWGKKHLLGKGLSNAKVVNGWAYNSGLGAYGTDYELRAGVAYNGLGANLDADALYPSSLTDADGDKYDGSKYNYVLHFDAGQTPPVNAFWSLTMYGTDGFLVANLIKRFAIGDRNNLVKNADGSVDIYIQNTSPGAGKENNWLPAPNAEFNLLLRAYWPKDELLKGTWKMSGVKKVKK